jgi:hypothetical protein
MGKMNTDQPRFIRPATLPGIGALIVLAGLGLLAAAVVGLSGSASAQAPTTTLVSGGPASPPKNVWISFGGSPLSAVVARARGIAACMRRNGVPNFPNPKLSGGQVWLLLPPGLSRTSPRIKRAQRACRKLLLQPGTTTNARGPSLTTTRP